MPDTTDVAAPVAVTASTVASHAAVKHRIRGVVMVAIALVLLFIAFMLLGAFAPEPGQHFSWGARITVAVIVLTGMFLLLKGSWGVFVVPGAVGALAGLLKVAAVLLLMAELSVGLLFGAFMTWALSTEYSGGSGSSSSSGFDFDSSDFDWDD